MALRVVFFGTPAFAVPTLERLVHSHHEVVGVISQPDRPRGRGQQISEAPVKALAVSLGLPVLQPERLARDLHAELHHPIYNWSDGTPPAAQPWPALSQAGQPTECYHNLLEPSPH